MARLSRHCPAKDDAVFGSEQGKISPTSHLLAEGKVASWQHRRPQRANCRHCDAVQTRSSSNSSCVFAQLGGSFEAEDEASWV